MVITSTGNGSLRIQSGETVLLIDPDSLRQKGDLTLKTSCPAEARQGAERDVCLPGEYELGGIAVRGWQIAGLSTEEVIRTAYEIEWEDLRLAVLGNLAADGLESILHHEFGGEIDVLIFGGDKKNMPADQAAKLIRQTEPAAVIPAGYSHPGEVAKALDKEAETSDRFTFKKKDLTHKQGRIIVLK